MNLFPPAALMRAATAALLAAALAACTSVRQPQPMPNYQPEAFDGKAYVRQFDFDTARTCEAARRALLSQGYLISSAQGEQVLGRKHFQPSPEHHVQLEFNVVCAAALGSGGEATTAFVSALKDQYVVRKSRESASVRLGALASLSMPVEGGMESMGKVASETITDPALYERFFQLVQGFLERYPAQPQAAGSSAPATTAAGEAATLEQEAAVLAADAQAWRDAETRQVEADDWPRSKDSVSERSGVTGKSAKKRTRVKKKIQKK